MAKKFKEFSYMSVLTMKNEEQFVEIPSTVILLIFYKIRMGKLLC